MADAPQPPRRKRSNGRGDRTREAILRAALSHFGERGYRGASLASIAESAGISEPGLLHHFPSKRDLLVAVLLERDTDDEKLFQTLIDPGDVSIIEAGTSIVAHNQDTPDGVRLFSVLLGESLETDNPAHDYFATRYRYARLYLAENIRAELGGEIPEELDLEVLAAGLVAMMDGLQFQWLLDDSIDMVASYRLLASMVLRALDLQEGPKGERPRGGALAAAHLAELRRVVS